MMGLVGDTRTQKGAAPPACAPRAGLSRWRRRVAGKRASASCCARWPTTAAVAAAMQTVQIAGSGGSARYRGRGGAEFGDARRLVSEPRAGATGRGQSRWAGQKPADSDLTRPVEVQKRIWASSCQIRACACQRGSAACARKSGRLPARRRAVTEESERGEGNPRPQ